MEMDEWVIWLVAAVLLAVGEVLTVSFFLFPFAIGAGGAAVAAALGAGTPASVAVFAVLTVACFAVVRPIARRHLRQAPQLRTGAAALVGRSATVLEPVSCDGGTVRLDGEVWTARPYDDDDVIAAGTRVHVLEIRGATALVTE
jgi:membrane protein implicated in regulation of membrane protease activity